MANLDDISIALLYGGYGHSNAKESTTIKKKKKSNNKIPNNIVFYNISCFELCSHLKAYEWLLHKRNFKAFMVTLKR